MTDAELRQRVSETAAKYRLDDFDPDNMEHLKQLFELVDISFRAWRDAVEHVRFGGAN